MSLHHRLRTAAGSPSDPYWSNTSLLLLGNGTNGGQNNTFIDSSSNNFTITRYGNVTQGSFSPFTIASGSEYSTGVNGGSGYFDGTGDYLATPSTSAIGGTAFTLEGWFYFAEAPTTATILCSHTSSGGIAVAFQSATAWGLASALVAYRLTTTTLPTVNAWNHIVVARSGTGTNQTSIWLNGTRVANGTVTDSFSLTSTFFIAWDNAPANPLFKGYISAFRFVTSDVYGVSNTSITVPSSPLTAITNTQLLLNFTNASILDSTGKNDLETVGDAQISTSVKKFGTASLKFDGTGDYLTIPKSSLLDFGTGDFTIEAWINPTAASGTIIDTRTQDTLDAYIFNILGASGKLDFVYSSSRVTSSGAISTSVWTHVAVVRSSGTIKLYINGTEDGSASYSSAVNAQAFASIGGGRSSASTSVNGYYFNGYIDDLRISKVARYTAAFTPPSRQLPAR